eukprot:170384-Karenia_brevis.AAC.1
MIQVKYGVPEARLATSQGLKATVLAWANSYGIPVDDRAALGYHLGRQTGSVKVYSRDRLNSPLQKLSA